MPCQQMIPNGNAGQCDKTLYTYTCIVFRAFAAGCNDPERLSAYLVLTGLTKFCPFLNVKRGNYEPSIMQNIALLVLTVAAGTAAGAHLRDNRLHNGIVITKDFPDGPIGQWWSYGLQFEVDLKFIVNWLDEVAKLVVTGSQRLDLPSATASNTRHEEQD